MSNKPELGHRTVPIQIMLGSGSAIKINAVKSFIEDWQGNPKTDVNFVFWSISNAKSQVNEQPVGELEILTGSLNRVLTSYQIDPRGEVYISMENGIEYDPELSIWSDYAIVLAFVPSYGSISYVRSKAVKFPSLQVEKTKNKDGGFKKNTVGKTLNEDGIVNKHDDPHLDLAGISRVEILKDALHELINYLPQGLFLKDPN
jgi:non-canonical (house-cleaning) NTP pyrophosphatase